MRAIARKHAADLHIAQGEVTGDIIADVSPQFSMFEEAVDDGADFVFGLLDLQTRLMRSYLQSQTELQLALE